MNPFSDGMYNVLREIFDEYQDIFDFDSFHVGGDEVSLLLISKYTLKNHIIDLISTIMSRVKYNTLNFRSTKHVGQKVK